MACDAPFGGVGASGMGQYHGREGFAEFTHARTIHRSGWWDPRQALGLVPPYSDKLRDRLRKMIKARPRFSRLMTVPMGVPMISAISL